MKHFRLSVDGKPYEIEILNDPRADEVQLKIDGKEITVKAENLDVEAAVVAAAPVAAPVVAAPVIAAAPVAAPVAAGANSVKAPLPGVVNAVKVSVGQTVKANDPLVVIEAMKAMNIIRSQRAGKVSKIYVSQGSHVAYGSALLDIE